VSQTLGSNGRVRFDKPRDRLNRARTEADLKAILVLVVEVRPAWDDAVEGGVYPTRTSNLGETRHTGFDDNDPTHTAATRPTQRQLRGSAKHAAVLIAEARQRLEDAARTLANGLLRSDPDEWIQHQEKRRAATQE
jgi:hypothetical protein